MSNKTFVLILVAVLLLPGIVVVVRGQPFILGDTREKGKVYWRRQGLYYLLVMLAMAVAAIFLVS